MLEPIEYGIQNFNQSSNINGFDATINFGIKAFIKTNSAKSLIILLVASTLIFGVTLRILERSKLYISVVKKIQDFSNNITISKLFHKIFS